MITSKLILYMCSNCNKLHNIYVQYMGHGDSGWYRQSDTTSYLRISRSRQNSQNWRIALHYDQCLVSSGSEEPVKFRKTLTDSKLFLKLRILAAGSVWSCDNSADYDIGTRLISSAIKHFLLIRLRPCPSPCNPHCHVVPVENGNWFGIANEG